VIEEEDVSGLDCLLKKNILGALVRKRALLASAEDSKDKSARTDEA
jgi:hypothetical protein